ncbi:hypothetical protein IWQ60_010662 [Tieghemiomyces parasiticus]|uniref:BZIP domain-containing protein n=1 Tax=Tieghemiomyces parasiticus TaxID=78921 RepID=A0A9W7ZPY2_9FUNG|nr:hypothetical protein IWQ60_010662 [Tieghemiomyces parasiticus]
MGSPNRPDMKSEENGFRTLRTTRTYKSPRPGDNRGAGDSPQPLPSLHLTADSSATTTVSADSGSPAPASPYDAANFRHSSSLSAAMTAHASSPCRSTTSDPASSVLSPGDQPPGQYPRFTTSSTASLPPLHPHRYRQRHAHTHSAGGSPYYTAALQPAPATQVEEADSPAFSAPVFDGDQNIETSLPSHHMQHGGGPFMGSAHRRRPIQLPLPIPNNPSNGNGPHDASDRYSESSGLLSSTSATASHPATPYSPRDYSGARASAAPYPPSQGADNGHGGAAAYPAYTSLNNLDGGANEISYDYADSSNPSTMVMMVDEPDRDGSPPPAVSDTSRHSNSASTNDPTVSISSLNAVSSESLSTGSGTSQHNHRYHGHKKTDNDPSVIAGYSIAMGNSGSGSGSSSASGSVNGSTNDSTLSLSTTLTGTTGRSSISSGLNGGNGMTSSFSTRTRATADERRQRRLLRNRIAAKECRRKKKVYVTALEEQVEYLTDELSRARKELEEANAKLTLGSMRERNRSGTKTPKSHRRRSNNGSAASGGDGSNGNDSPTESKGSSDSNSPPARKPATGSAMRYLPTAITRGTGVATTADGPVDDDS